MHHVKPSDRQQANLAGDIKRRRDHDAYKLTFEPVPRDLKNADKRPKWVNCDLWSFPLKGCLRIYNCLSWIDVNQSQPS